VTFKKIHKIMKATRMQRVLKAAGIAKKKK